MNYRETRQKACSELFADFQPDYSKSRKPDLLRQIRDLASDGLYSHEIAERLGISPKAVQKTYRRYNFPVLHNYHPPLREDRIGWAGGVKEVNGYLYSRTPGHPRASKHGNYVAVHRLIVEQKINRYLLSHEVVDHIDGNTKNNHPDNLRVFQSNAEHLRQTLAGRVPNWSQDGLKSLAEARSQPRRTWKGVRIEPIHAELKTDVGQ